MAVPLDSFLGLPRAIQRRWLRRCAESLGITLEFRHVEALLELAAGESSNREGELPGGWVAVRSNRELNFEPRSRAPQEPPPYDYRLPVPGEVTVAETGSLFRAILCPAGAAGAGYNREQFLDARALPPELTVRNWRPGDRFWPAHSKAPRKVKELLQEKRISGRDRAQWPVVVSRDKVVFLRGFGPAADLLLPDGDAAGILIEEVRPTGETCPTR